ncbi:MAG TPA: hypothetical protein VFV95_21810 [Vicinamibacterales bacterium]|nr:hypothetical protein [Vicinamibacterales bacterium]
MARRLFTLIVAVVVGGGPLARELCQIFCASTSAVPAHTHAHHANGQLDHRHHDHIDPRLKPPADDQQQQAAMRVPAGAHPNRADDIAAVAPASHLCRNWDASLVSVAPQGGPPVSDCDPATTASLALVSMPTRSGATYRSPDVRSPIPLPLLTPLRV